MTGDPNAPHFPRSAPIEAYGKGGFAFAVAVDRHKVRQVRPGIRGRDHDQPSSFCFSRPVPTPR